VLSELSMFSSTASVIRDMSLVKTRQLEISTLCAEDIGCIIDCLCVSWFFFIFIVYSCMIFSVNKETVPD